MANVKKEWMFNFIGGGFNTVYATTKDKAIKLAKITYPNTQINESSFIEVEKNPEAYQMALNAFF
jgi:hypothetical protein